MILNIYLNNMEKTQPIMVFFNVNDYIIKENYILLTFRGLNGGLGLIISL